MLFNSDKKEDYCLGKLDYALGKLVCSSRKMTETSLADSNHFGYPVSKDGVYAVIFNPE